MDWHAFSDYLNQSLHGKGIPAIHIESVHAIAGGDSHQSYQLHTTQKNYFLKLNQASCLPMLATELHSLNAIEQSQTIRSPHGIASGVFNQQAWLLMEFVPLKTAGDDVQRGRALAHMHHQIHHDMKPFGWFENNFIGQTPQQNLWQSDWVTFYGQQRLKPQLELAVLRDAPTSLYHCGMQLIDKLPAWFTDYQPEASLLHGDLWGGNSAFTDNGDPVIFDPACYYGDRETDLAMTEMFGGFTAQFYAGYNTIFPIDVGYQQRKPLYQLYHQLNHFNLFGGHYAQQAEDTISQLLRQHQ